MTTDDIKKRYKDEYQKAGLFYEEELDGRIVFSRGRGKSFADTQDFSEYIEHERHFGDYVNGPNECSICSTTIREQALEEVGRGRANFFL